MCSVLHAIRERERERESVGKRGRKKRQSARVNIPSSPSLHQMPKSTSIGILNIDERRKKKEKENTQQIFAIDTQYFFYQEGNRIFSTVKTVEAQQKRM